MHPIAINIFLIPSKEIKDICDNIYINDKSEYSSEGLDYFPHITLSQKGFSKADLKKLIFDLEKLKINKFELET
jgi:2'-5' RNA ligase